ncbi:MAG: HD domain-containing protein [Firmicutes bacterium]|nr:HD domain-containing protein [Bacillota bacterium]
MQSIMEDPLFAEYLSKNSIKEADRKFCRHTFQHLVDVARITYIQMLESGGIKSFCEEKDINMRLAREIIYAAALLHDIGRWKEYETGEDHAAVSAELARDILRRTGFRESEIRIITTAISEHRRTTENMSVLGTFLYRADNQSRLCLRCEASNECYKFDQMETARKGLIY